MNRFILNFSGKNIISDLFVSHQNTLLFVSLPGNDEFVYLVKVYITKFQFLSIGLILPNVEIYLRHLQKN